MSQEEKNKTKEYQRKKHQELLEYKKEVLKIKLFFYFFIFYFFSLNTKMSEKRLKFNNIKLNRKEFHKSKETIDLLSVDVDQIVVSYKFKHFIGYQEGEVVKPLSIFFTSNE